ncbi:Starch-binding associating with outer membrane [Zhouia amylolytica]|uniref:Starch-binding associating with outer membrane n=1 Tax=Zhouia amylolytica TaxID=376730 RepID=A0A1I6TYF5_9FLAO|nr:SusD/RagB family nutrient-binding outer membrane lipoprotein [Zhouia amylolytica]MCQ0111076.1 SusD/RagB family nutrient-binding outer membrane lipoprotein [Zhouia amylolytica]SFS94273.1 Starch-binding associating with outer membrane [Zhouia amylolytica]
MKKINLNKIWLCILALSLSFTACDTVDFGDMNVDPNSPTDASSASLLTNAERTLDGIVSSTTTNCYVQYLSNGQYDEESRYQTLNWGFNGLYATLVDLQKVIELNTDEATKVNAQAYGSNGNQIAAATILRVYLLHHMTDRWGMIPYTEAIKGLENQYPKYDSQESIYMGLFDEIDSALGMINSGNGPTGDYLLNGDMTLWREFGNTIKMTMALRLSNADPTTGSAKFNEAYNNAISSNANNIYYPYLNEDTNDNFYQDHFVDQGRRDYLISDVFADALIGSGTPTVPEDPRLTKMADPATNSGTYVGAPYGQSNSATDDYSFITADIITKSDAPLYIYTYSEVLFARAEAAALGWTSEDASALYDQAIAASMEQWGVDATEATAYITLNPYSSLEDIAYEKWVAMFLQGYNSWAEWRRQKAMGYERPLTAPDDLLSNATGIPQRHAYSATAGALNEENYNAAVSAQGPDNLDTILWINQ